MLFTKTLRRDLANLAGVVFSTLFTIMVTTSLIRLLGGAANGSLDTASVLPLIAFTAVNYLPILLILTLYVSVLMALTRAYQDSEMVVWFASGQSLLAWVRPVLQFTLPFVILVAVVAFAVAPWANQQSAELRHRFEQRQDIAQIAPGEFRESAAANRVFFVESVSDDQASVRNVFVTQQHGENLTVVVSNAGHIESMPNGDRFMVLEKGRRYDSVGDSPEFKLMEFERYGVLIDNQAPGASEASTKAMSTTDLMADPTPRQKGELLWRVSLPIMALLLALLAIPMSAFNPRVGRSVNLIVALLSYVLYSNLVSLVQGWVAQGRMPFGLAVWIVHALMAVLVAFLFWRRMSLKRWTWPWRRVRAVAVGGGAA